MGQQPNSKKNLLEDLFGFAMPQFTIPTFHAVKLVCDNDEATNVWNIRGYRNLSRTNVRLLPSWRHLPSDPVAVANSLLLTIFGYDPVASIQELLHTKITVRKLETHLQTP